MVSEQMCIWMPRPTSSLSTDDCGAHLQVRMRQLWGTDVYTDDSDLLAGALLEILIVGCLDAALRPRSHSSCLFLRLRGFSPVQCQPGQMRLHEYASAS